MGGGKRPLVEDPLHLGERRGVAQVCRRALELEGLPAVVDDVDDQVALAYDAWPSRLVLVDRDGKVAYQSMRGPYGLDPDELEGALRELLGD